MVTLEMSLKHNIKQCLSKTPGKRPGAWDRRSSEAHAPQAAALPALPSPEAQAGLRLCTHVLPLGRGKGR